MQLPVLPESLLSDMIGIPIKERKHITFRLHFQNTPYSYKYDDGYTAISAEVLDGYLDHAYLYCYGSLLSNNESFWHFMVEGCELNFPSEAYDKEWGVRYILR